MADTRTAPTPGTRERAPASFPRPRTPGTPDARGPWRFLWWLIAFQPGRILTGALWKSWHGTT